MVEREMDLQKSESDMDVNNNSEDSCSTESDSETDEEYKNSKNERRIRSWNQAKINDMVRKLGLPKDSPEYLA